MTDAIQTLDGGRTVRPAAGLGGLHHAVWGNGLLAAVAWAAAAVITIGLRDVVPWGSAGLFAYQDTFRGA